MGVLRLLVWLSTLGTWLCTQVGVDHSSFDIGAGFLGVIDEFPAVPPLTSDQRGEDPAFFGRAPVPISHCLLGSNRRW